jgi:ketosteroid isomerase-like protein
MMLSLALALTLVVGQSKEADVTRRELEHIEGQLATTWKNGDCDGWGAFLAPDWSVIHITGTVMTKAQALEMCRASRAPIEKFSMDELRVRAFGDAAVVTGRSVFATGGASGVTITSRFTDVFVRSAGRWQIVASHATRIAP